jgi:hypothetical protein
MTKEEIEQLKKQLNDISDKIKQLEKPQFEVGKWYKIEDLSETGVVCIKEIRDNYILVYGKFPLLSDWQDSWEIKSDSIYGKEMTPATDKEVEEALKAEAVKKGIKVGVTLDRQNLVYNKHKVTINKEFAEWEFVPRLNQLMHHGVAVFEEGNWAEIVKEEKIMIDRYEVKFETVTTTEQKREFGTKIDGHFFSKLFWESAKVVSLNNKAKIMVGCSKQFDVSLETINKILDKLK